MTRWNPVPAVDPLHSASATRLPRRVTTTLFTVICVCLWLGGCGGGGSSSDAGQEPVIVTPPTSHAGLPGASVTFTVTVQGTGLSYRWQLSTDGGTTWGDIVNAILAQYTVSNPTAAMDSYRYRAVVTGSSGTSVTTAPATLSVASSSRNAGDVYRDCSDLCPDLVVLPQGTITMGVRTATDVFRDQSSPAHTVTIGYDLAVGRTEVTRAEFARFVQATSYRTDAEKGAGCWAEGGSTSPVLRTDRNWSTPGFAQTDTDPAVCISWNDAKAYIAWLNSASPVASYRLLTEAEWEYAARAGQLTARYPWGDDLTHQQICTYANSVDRTATATVPRLAGLLWSDCTDGYAYTAPADAFPANAFGLRHMIGNAWEWVEDGWHTNYTGAPANGSAWAPPAGDTSRIYRGGSWGNHPSYLDPAYRAHSAPNYSDESVGFRIARAL